MRRLRRLAMVLSLFLVLADMGSHGLAREITRKIHGVQSVRRSSREPRSSTATASVVVSVEHRCKSKVVAFCSSVGNGEKTNSTMEDDKRVVPTGPNPLHNR